MLLYECWRQVADRNLNRVALWEPSGEWTFRALVRALADRDRDRRPGPAFLSGRSSEFVLGLLRAWRDGRVVVPLEDGHPVEEVSARFRQAALPDSVVHVKTTSGSTGNPRHALFTAEHLAADAAQIVSTMGLRPDCPNIGVISLAHSYGFSNLVLPLVLHGVPLRLVPDPLPETMRRALAATAADSGVTLPAVPAMWRSWHAAGVITRNRIRLAISAGAPLPTILERTVFEASGLKIHNFLGSSECGGIAYDRTGTPRAEDTQWIGSALDGVSLSTSKSGALCVHSQASGLAYWPEPDPAILGGGRFQTSDLVRLENDRDVFLLGRADDIINVSGRKVHPAEIESLLNAQPGVRHCVVFGIPSARIGRTDDIAAVVSLDPGIALLTLKKSLTRLLPEWKCPRHWLVDPQLIPDARGKISRAHWKTRFLDRHPQ